MPTLFLAAPTNADEADLLAFELTNRAFFERNINARSAEYYSLAGVRKAITAAIDDAKAGTAYQYLVRDETGRLIARVNLSRVKRAHFYSAEVGYRVAEAAIGKGVAAEAVRQVVNLAFFQHKLYRVEATARPENAGSIKVLERNGFKQFGRSSRSFQLNEVWYDLLYFERHADA